MANVQIDNGEFTRIANVILENLSSAKLNGCQYAIILVILRFTYGFQRKEHDLSLTFIEKATGFDKRLIQRNLKVLEENKIIIQKVKSGTTRTISFNKDYESWTYGLKTYGEKTVGKLANGQNTAGDTVNPPIVTYGESAYQERKSFKKNIKEISTTTADAYESVGDIHLKVFKTFSMSGLMSDFVRKIKDKGHTDEFVKELMLEAGESAGGVPNIRFIETIYQSWDEKNINSREESKEDKKKRTNNVHSFKHKNPNQKPSLPIIADVPKSAPLSDEKREEHRRIAELLDGDTGTDGRR